MIKPSHSSAADKQVTIPIHAAMYVRTATDYRNSSKMQADTIREFAARNAIEIIETYIDSGKSSLKLEGNEALKRLIDDVKAGRALFSMILLLDMTRWGRFQNGDESAYYEHLLRRAGIAIRYVTESGE